LQLGLMQGCIAGTEERTPAHLIDLVVNFIIVDQLLLLAKVPPVRELTQM